MTTKPRTRPTGGELTFAAAGVVCAMAIGAKGATSWAQMYGLFVVWAGLTGTMAPRLLKANRVARELAVARAREEGQRLVNHDMASALLTIEGAVAALRHVHGAEVDDRVTSSPALPDAVESIASAIEAEIGRIRRVTLSAADDVSTCSVETTVEPLVALHRAGGAAIVAELEADEPVAMPADDLARVVSNVLDNCVRHAPGASISLSGRAVSGQYQLRIEDDGPGIVIDVASRAFEQGVSTLPGGGLGLFSSRSLVEQCGGTVSIRSSTAGTAVTFDLPYAHAQMAQASAGHAISQDPVGVPLTAAPKPRRTPEAV